MAYGQPQQSRPRLMRVIVAIAVVYFIVRGINRHSTSPTPSPSNTGTEQRQPARAIAEIQRRIGTPATMPAGEGIAAAILIDTSGSMGDSVRDASDGQTHPKIQIAQRCVLDLIRSSEQFAQQHRDTRVLLGVYEFSARQGDPCRRVVELGAPNLARSEPAVRAMRPSGGTPIGEAIVTAKRDLDATGILRQHILIVTDGENNQSFAPADVLTAMSHMNGTAPAAVYFVAFDTSAEPFAPVRAAGGTLLSASNAKQLQETLQTLLSGQILVE